MRNTKRHLALLLAALLCLTLLPLGALASGEADAKTEEHPDKIGEESEFFSSIDIEPEPLVEAAEIHTEADVQTGHEDMPSPKSFEDTIEQERDEVEKDDGVNTGGSEEPLEESALSLSELDAYADVSIAIAKDGKTAHVTGDASGLYVRVALIIENNGSTGLYVTQCIINDNGVIIVPTFAIPGLTVRGINVALVPSLEEISLPTPTVVSSAFMVIGDENDAAEEPIQLTSLKSINATPRTTTRLTDNYGKSYGYAVINEQGWTGSAGPVTYEYLVGAKYSRFCGTMYIPSGESSNGTSTLIIKGDGHILYCSPVLNKRSSQVDIDIDVSGFDRITIQWNNNSTYNNISDLHCCLADARFYEAEFGNAGTVLAHKDLPIAMTDITSIAESPRTTTRFTDNYGNTYGLAIVNNHGYSGSAGPITYEYLLHSKYSRFSGTIYVPSGETSSGTSTLTIKGDGRTIYTSPAMTKTSAPVTIDVDISGYNDIVIQWSNNSGYSNISGLNCCIAYPFFYEA